MAVALWSIKGSDWARSRSTAWGSGRVSFGDGAVDVFLYDEILINLLMKVLMGWQIRRRNR